MVWPLPVYQDRPPSKSWHQAVGWSAPIAPAPGVYVRSSRLASTCTSARGLVWKLYHSSKRVHLTGSDAVDGCAGSSTLMVAVWLAGCDAKYAPTRSPYQAQLYSVSEAAWMPA
jgi:hypothetical protein